jgi:hypothetical protein
MQERSYWSRRSWRSTLARSHSVLDQWRLAYNGIGGTSFSDTSIARNER